jgi:carboxylesterase type B
MILSPLTRGLFKRAILQSGGINTKIACRSKDESLKIMKKFSTDLECNDKTLGKQIECLKSKTQEELQTISFPSLLSQPLAVFGDDFLPVSPTEALKTGKLNEVDLLSGVTRNEGENLCLN